MITAKNYAAQCEADLIKVAGEKYDVTKVMKLLDLDSSIIQSTRLAGNGTDSVKMAWTAIEIHNAVHFVLPDGGKLLSDDLIAFKDKEARLPFPIITLEFLETYERGNCKFLILARESTLDKMIELGKLNPRVKNEEEDPGDSMVIEIITAFQIPGHVWTLFPFSALVPSRWNVTENGQNCVRQVTRPCLVERCAELINERGEDFLIDVETQLTVYLRTLLAFLEALSCTNVEYKIFQKESAKNVKRVNRGKLPIYETKMLTIKVPNKVIKAYNNLGGTHASPRQHVRMGHIRRLPTGKNTWVNSCIVGDPLKGKIDKTYLMEN